MRRSFLLGYLLFVVILALAWLTFGGSTSAAERLMDITPTPTEPSPTPVTPTVTPTRPPENGVMPTATPTMGTPYLPESGQATPTPAWLLVTVAGGLLVLAVWLLRRVARLFEPSRGE